MYKKYTPANPPPLCILSETYILYIPYRSLFLVEGFGKISSLVFEDFIVGSKWLSDFWSRKTRGQSPPTLYPSLAPRVWHEWPGDPEMLCSSDCWCWTPGEVEVRCLSSAKGWKRWNPGNFRYSFFVEWWVIVVSFSQIQILSICVLQMS